MLAALLLSLIVSLSLPAAASTPLFLSSASAQETTLPDLPAGWPTALQLGLMDSPGGAAALKATAPFGFRYQYLAGGANTGQGWATWNPDGQFVTYYIDESIRQGIIPVFSYYMMYHSAPGNTQDEPTGFATNLENPATMTAYYNDLKLFFQRAGAYPRDRVVLHVEPDLWGFMQKRSLQDDATSIPVQVGATGLPELSGLPNDAAGFARAIKTLRDRYAPNVWLAYHLSVWGTSHDIAYSDPPDATVDELGHRAGAFYLSLGTDFDLVFAEFSDRDAAFKQYIYGDGGAAWWDADDFRRNQRFLRQFVGIAQKRVVLWQIPLGNTKMRAMNNTWNHFQDNRVEWLLDDPGRAHLNEYLQAGVVAFLFGRGADGATCACDAERDGETNPEPINGNSRLSLNADDDGGFFREKAQAYYAGGPLSLGEGSSPTGTPTPTSGLNQQVLLPALLRTAR